MPQNIHNYWHYYNTQRHNSQNPLMLPVRLQYWPVLSETTTVEQFGSFGKFWNRTGTMTWQITTPQDDVVSLLISSLCIEAWQQPGICLRQNINMVYLLTGDCDEWINTCVIFLIKQFLKQTIFYWYTYGKYCTSQGKQIHT